MTKLRVGVVGLGSIAQKAYLPILGQAADWTLVGGFRPISKSAAAVRQLPHGLFLPSGQPGRTVRRGLCPQQHRQPFSVIGELLNRGVHVYVDKPLAETLEQGEQLLELAERRGKTLMVGFNRRFAPLYRQLKQQMNQPASIRMDKHRADSVGPHDLRFTLLDDYLHVVDTALWLAGGGEQLLSGSLCANAAGEMLYAEHHFACGGTQVTTSMHRRGGSLRESVQAVTDGALYQLTDMRHWLREDAQGVLEQPVPGWQSTLVQRGFDGAVRHFLSAVANQSAPETGGEQALVAQRVVERLLRDNSM